MGFRSYCLLWDKILSIAENIDFSPTGYFPEGETSYQSDDSVDVIDASPEQSSERIVATKTPEIEPLQTMGSRAGRESVEQPARVSNLELENKLLRKEVESLNEELVSLHHRSKEAQESKICHFFVEQRFS